MVTSHNEQVRNRGKASQQTALTVWVRAGGICARPGCGELLHKDPLLFKYRKLGELAHNVAARATGPRGSAARSAALADDPANLVLLCPRCHTLVDKDEGVDYPEELLRQWKADHEAHVEAAAIFTSGKKVVPIIIEGPIGDQLTGIQDHAVLTGLLHDKAAPVAGAPFRLTLPDFIAEAGTSDWWRTHLESARGQIKLWLNDQRTAQYPLAAFPLAEMPSLMVVGHLLGDKRKLLPFQYRRDKGDFIFSDPSAKAAEIFFRPPALTGGTASEVALAISLTASISPDRIHAALGRSDIPIFEIWTTSPGTDLVRNRQTIEAFSKICRECLNAIEAAVGGPTGVVHVFPVMPAPLALAFGSTINDKVSPSLHIYDGRGKGGAFRQAVTLPFRNGGGK